MKIYIAGKWTDKQTVRARMDTVRRLGHTITHDWTAVEHSNAPEEMRYYADLDVKGVIASELFIALLEDPKYAYRGTFTELGVALAKAQIGYQQEIWIVCPDPNAYARSNVFFQHPHVKHFTSWDTCCMILNDS